MSTEFNYARAHREWAVPEYHKLPICIKALLMRIGEYDPPLRQGPGTNIEWPDKALKRAFALQPTEDLLKGIEVIYAVGHWADPENLEQVPEAGNGNYWRFEILAKRSIIERGSAPDGWPQPDIRRFMEHKEGTEYDNEEVTNILKPLLTPLFTGVKVTNVNYRVEGHAQHNGHPFCIGPEHFPKDGGLYLDPRHAPCSHCHYGYDLHKSDRVIVLGLSSRDDDKLTKKEIKVLKSIDGLMKTYNLDGFAFKRG